MTLAFALLLLHPSEPGEIEWRAALGGEINRDPHGVVDGGVRQGPWSLQLLTDTLDARYAPELIDHRWWIGLRAEALAAGLFISPWTKGAPDPTRALFASYAGADAGWIAYLGSGFYAGVEGSARGYVFGRRAETTVDVPKPSLLVSPAARAGWWSEAAELVVMGGVDVEIDASESTTAPKLTLYATTHPLLVLGPRLELRAGYQDRATDLMKTRLGGLNPYVVPLAGAAWAEFWVEKYAALRAGPELALSFLEVAAVVDVARFDGMTAYGLALLSAVSFPPYKAEAAFGYAPEIERQSGVARYSVWIVLGRSWAAGY